MKGYSMTMTGIIISVAGTLLLKAGFSEVCSNELISTAPLIIGGIISWYGRLRGNDLTMGGFRKA